MPVSEDELLNRLLRGYAEEVRIAAGLTRHLGLAARMGDRGGFAAARAAFEDARKRSEAYRLSIEMHREMLEARRDAGSRRGWSVVSPASQQSPFALPSPHAGESIRVNPAA